MRSVVFCGPSLDVATAKELLPDAEFRGPAQCGDVYLAGKLSPAAIAIVDGYFDHRLPVWHKEILWVLSQGIAVYGAASMGALRAAELFDYGMLGVGVIYEQFLNGELEDDDEVAVLHEPPECGYKPRSEAMVNIRATLRAAWSAGVIDSAAEAAVIAAAKSLFYPDRTLAAALKAATELRQPIKTRLNKWLDATGPVDQKRADAIALLRRMHADSSLPATSQLRFRFSQTNYWRTLQHNLDRTRSSGATLASTTSAAANWAGVAAQRASAPVGQAGERRVVPSCLGALEQHDPAAYQRAHTLAVERALSLELARRAGARVSALEVQQASERFRMRHGLLTPEATSRWLAENSMDLAAFSELSRDEVLVTRFADQVRAAALEQLPAALRAMGLAEHVAFCEPRKQ